MPFRFRFHFRGAQGDRALQPGGHLQRVSLHCRSGRARPGKGELVAGGIAEQTTRALENLRAVLAAGGHRFLSGGEDHGLSGRHGGLHRHERGLWPRLRQPPAGPLDRGGRGSPRGARVEIEVIAAVSGER